MANKVTIDIEARFQDNATDKAKAASKAIDGIGKGADAAGKKLDSLGKKVSSAEKKVDGLGKKKAKATLDADDSKLINKLKGADSKLNKLKNSKARVLLTAMDKASAVISKLLGKAKSFGGKTYSALLKIRDSNALATLRKVTSSAKSFAGKTWSAMVKIKDYATAPLTKIKNSLFSIKSLVMAITAGFAAKQFIGNPVALADAYSGAQIGFSTLLGESRGQQMMNELDAFAKATPFNSSQVIAQTQRMLAMGWDAENIIKDMETIGDAAAATGKGSMGLEQIVTALAQIKTKGKLSTEELNQLAEAGISAKRYVAEGLGYGTGDEGIAKMTKDLENGAIASGKALDALLSGMKEYQGMMDRTANETVSGLWSQIQDTFEINIARRWGQGLQDGFKKSFGSIVDIIDQADGALNQFGDTIYEVGATISNWLAARMENAVKRITDITDSFEFRNASLGEKMSMLWNGVIVDPLKEWWEGGGQQKTAETAGKIGAWLGKTLSSIFKGILGMTDVLDGADVSSGAASVAQSFAKGFVDNFDVSGITAKIADAISNVWNALPWWGKLMVGGYAGGKVIGGIGSLAGGIANIVGVAKGARGFIGSTGNAMVRGSGLLGGLSSAGYTLTGGAAGSALSGGAAALAGAGGIAGGLTMAAGGAHILNTGYQAYKGWKSGDKTEFLANSNRAFFTGAGMATGVATGASIGASIGMIGGPLGALIGGGLGTIVGWFAGDKIAKNIEAAKFESEEMKEAIKDSEMSAEQLNQQFEKAKWENAKKHFGDMKLSLSEIQRLADQIVWGDDLANYDKFTGAAKQAEASLQSLKSAADSTDRWMWKAGLGVKFNGDEIDAIKASFDEYINSAKSYVENKHYEFTAAVSMLVDVDSAEGKSIIDTGNAFYAKMQEQLDSLGSKLSSTVDIALEDGVISLDEQAEIANLQQQIAEITEKIANAEGEAEMELIKVKFGGGNLDIDSFDTFMEQMNTTLQERIAANDEAFTASVASLKLELQEGAISQEEYNAQLQTLIEGYEAKVEKIQADVMGVELNIIGDAYKQELGDDVVADLQNALQYCLENNLDPIDLDVSKLCELVGAENLSAETAANLQEMLSGVYDQIQLVEVDGKLLLDLGVEVEGDPGTEAENQIKGAVPESVDGGTTTANVTADYNLTNPPSSSLFFTGPTSLINPITLPSPVQTNVQAKYNVTSKLQGKDIESKIDSSYGPFDTEAKVAPNYSVTKFSATQSTFGIKSSYSFSPTVTISPIFNSNGPKRFRGGIVGGSSSMGQFARGGLAGYSEGGMVRGGAQLITVAEEGSPEMIIPMSSQRRGRALKLWAQAGHMLDVPGFARGGVIGGDGSTEEGIRFTTSDGNSGGQSVMVEVNGVNVAIQVDATGHANIAEAIQEQSGEIAETVAGILADAFGAQFENTPTRGGVA